MSANPYAEKLKALILNGYDCCSDDGMPQEIHPQILYQGMDFTGEIRTCHGAGAFVEFVRGFAPLCEKSRDEIFAAIPVGDSSAIVHGRGHRTLRYTGKSISYDYVMIGRFEDGKLREGADLPDQKGCEAWREAWIAMNKGLLEARPHTYVKDA